MAEELEKQEQEVVEALKRGEIAEPISMTAILTSLAISAATTAASFLISRIFAPKAPVRRQGEMSGSINVMQSEQGIFINEVYGRDPGFDPWEASTVYALHATRRPTAPNGLFYKVDDDGISGATEPTWPTTVGATVVDGTVTWRAAGLVGGGCRFAPIIPWTSGIRKTVTVSRQEVGGGKGPPRQTQTTETTTYDLDVALMHGRGPAETLILYANTDVILDQRPASTSGILDDTVVEDDDYDQDTLPGTGTGYSRPIDRHSGVLDLGAHGEGTGTIVQGAYASIADYVGNDTQLPDPVIQAAVDGALGADSTPAYRGRHYTRLGGFSLTRWGGFLPNFTGVHQHQTVKTLKDFCDAMCERVGMESGDYDFSALAGIDLRGLLIAGRRYQPREVMEVCARVFNFYFCETVDGQLVGRLQDEAAALTIADTEIGWLDKDPDDDQPLPELSTTIPNEIALPKRVDVKFIDPAKEYEPNLQSAVRQITPGVEEQSLEVQITMLDTEAREVAQRELYQEHVEATRHGFTLPWTYLYLDPGRVIQINRAEGFSHTIRIPAIKGGISILDCEGYAVETAVFTQPVSTDGGTGFETPPVPIPAMTVMILLDTPLLRDRDETENNGLGMYFAATPRTGDNQIWQGAALYVDKVGWERIAETTLPATMGLTTNVLGANAGYGFQSGDTVTVDLYGTTLALESATEDDLLKGANAALIGDEIVLFKTATRVGGHPNRWTLTGMWRGQRGTADKVGTHMIDERFALLNEAIIFVPRPLSDVDLTQDYRAVTFGQSLDDSAVVPFTWTGKTQKPLPPTQFRSANDSVGNTLIEFERSVRLSAPLTNSPGAGVAEEVERYALELTDSSFVPLANTPPLDIYVGTAVGAALISSGAGKFVGVSQGSTLSSDSTGITAISLQQIEETGNFVEANLESTFETNIGGRAVVGLIHSEYDWRTLAEDEITGDDKMVAAATAAFRFYTTAASAYSCEIYAGGVLQTTLTDIPNSSRLSIHVSSREIRFYKDYRAGSKALWIVADQTIRYPLRGIAHAAGRFFGGSYEGSATVRSMMMRTQPHPKTLYLISQRVRDYVSGGATAYGNLYQISARRGRGIPLRVTF